MSTSCLSVESGVADLVPFTLTIVSDTEPSLEQFVERSDGTVLPADGCASRCSVAESAYRILQEITALIAVVGRLTPPLRATTRQTLIALLTITGLRKSEACNLDRDQVDLDTGVLGMADSKSGKSRQVFLHDSAIVALHDYQRRRDRWCPHTPPGVFV
ncbi:MAG: tyrosine-type recombinase/integrase, partial [Actinomycetota bacterium]|nr:tyrosine-type recombinase/integrase [Actinomycetota bacterium]